MENVEKICELFKATQLEESVKSLRDEGKPAFMKLMYEVDQKIEAERRAALGYFDPKNTPEKPVNLFNKIQNIKKGFLGNIDLMFFL